MYLFPMDGDFAGRRNSQSNLATSDLHDGDLDLLSDDDPLSDVPC
jgi:hypothetical protein